MSSDDRVSPSLSVAIDDANVLRAAHMPFIVNGGLFIPTPGRYRLGDEVFVILRLMRDQLPLAGKVVWITPAGSSGGRPSGVGVQFGEHDDVVRQHIDSYLGESPETVDDSYTL